MDEDGDRLFAAWCEEARRILAVRAGVDPGSRDRASEAMVDALTAAGEISPVTGQPYHRNAVAHWVRGQTVPRPHTLLVLARLTGLSLDRLAGLHGSPEVGLVPGRDISRELGQVEERLEAMLGRLRATAPAAGGAARRARVRSGV